jgi:hypothetical protein
LDVEGGGDCGEELSRGELNVVEGVGHMLIFIREADEVNGWIVDFFRKLQYK